MHKKIYSILFTIIFLFIGFISSAQDSASDKKIEMADGLRSNGKIYVVVAVVVIILLGVIAYVIRLDRKITKMENEGDNK